jgi:primosomal protein N'
MDIDKGIIIGPAPALIGMIKDQYRFALYIKHSDHEALVRVKDVCENECVMNLPAGVYVQYDFDPIRAF